MYNKRDKVLIIIIIMHFKIQRNLNIQKNELLSLNYEDYRIFSWIISTIQINFEKNNDY